MNTGMVLSLERGRRPSRPRGPGPSLHHRPAGAPRAAIPRALHPQPRPHTAAAPVLAARSNRLVTPCMARAVAPSRTSRPERTLVVTGVGVGVARLWLSAVSCGRSRGTRHAGGAPGRQRAGRSQLRPAPSRRACREAMPGGMHSRRARPAWPSRPALRRARRACVRARAQGCRLQRAAPLRGADCVQSLGVHFKDGGAACAGSLSRSQRQRRADALTEAVSPQELLEKLLVADPQELEQVAQAEPDIMSFNFLVWLSER